MGATWVPSSSSCRSGCRPSAPRRCSAFAQAYLRRLAAAGDDDGHDAEALYHEVAGRLRARGLARRRADGGAGLQPDPRRARLRARRLGRSRPTPRTCPSSWTPSAPSCRPAAWASCACCTRSSAPSARPTAASPASCIPRGAPATESVMHFELDRRLAPEDLADLEDAVRSVLADVRRVVRDFPPLRERVEAIDRGRARGRRALRRRTRWPRSSPSCEWLARDNFIFLGARDYELRRRRAARRRRAPAWGCSTTRRARPSPSPVAVETLDPSAARARAGRRAAAGLQDQPPVAGAPPRAHGLRRHPPRLAPTARSSARRACIGLFTTKAYAEPASETPRAAPQAAADPRQRGPHRGLARLQGRGLALRVLPQGRALRRAHRRPARRGRRAAGAAGRAGARPRPPRRRRAHRVDHRRAAQGRLRRGAARAPARLPAPALRRQHGRRPRGARPRATACACTSRSTAPRAACPSSRAATSRPRSSSSRARGTTAPATSSSRATARSAGACWPSAGPRACPTPTRRPSTRRRRPTTSAASSACSPAARPSTSACATSPTGSRASGCTASATRSSSPRRCRRSSTSACAWSRSAPRGCSAATAPCGCRTSACSARPTSRSTSRSAASASRSASPRSGAARRSRTR